MCCQFLHFFTPAGRSRRCQIAKSVLCGRALPHKKGTAWVLLRPHPCHSHPQSLSQPLMRPSIVSIAALAAASSAAAQSTAYCGTDANPGAFVRACLAAQATLSCGVLTNECSASPDPADNVYIGHGMCQGCDGWIPLIVAPQTRATPVWDIRSLGRERPLQPFSKMCSSACNDLGFSMASDMWVNSALGTCLCAPDGVAPMLNLPQRPWDSAFANTSAAQSGGPVAAPPRPVVNGSLPNTTRAGARPAASATGAPAANGATGVGNAASPAAAICSGSLAAVAVAAGLLVLA